MAPWQGFIGGSGATESLLLDGEQTINYYVEQIPGGPKALFPSPGFVPWGQVPDVGSRASLNANGRLFKVMGGGFYEFAANGAATKWGAVAIDANPAQIIYNGVVGGQLGIASGGNIYTFVLATNTFAPTTRLGGYSHLCFAGGFGLAFQSTTGKVFISAPDDLTTWDDATFFQRSLFADPYTAMFVDANNLVWMLGTDTLEVRYNSGQGTQPFIPLTGLVAAYGIAAPFAFAVTGLGNFWLSRNREGVGQFVVTRGSTPSSLNTPAFSTAIAAYLRNGGIADAEVLPYQQQGHTFIALAFPSAQAAGPASPTTWVYDADGQNWTQRGRWTGAVWDVWAPRTHAVAFNKHLVGDRTTGQVSIMDTAYATEIDGSGIVRERTAPILTAERRRVPIDAIELWTDTGFGTPSGQGSDPVVTLQLSTDSGRTYGNARRASIGRLGEYRKRVYWLQCGAPDQAVARVRVSDPVPSRIVDAWLNNADSVGRAA